MEELQDAIEDAQYVNEIAQQDDGPRPVLPWKKPTEEELEIWKQSKKKESKDAFSMEWTMQEEIGLFLFSSYLKETHDDYARINFCEEVYRFRKYGVQGRSGLKRAKSIIKQFLVALEKDPVTGEVVLPRRSLVFEHDLKRPNSIGIPKDQMQKLYTENMDFPACSECAVGLKGAVRREIVEKVQNIGNLYRSSKNKSSLQESAAAISPIHVSSRLLNSNITSTRNIAIDDGADITETSTGNGLHRDLFDNGESLVMESLKRDYWRSFLESAKYKRLLDFLWFRDRRVEPDDFFEMRRLGRGGFGLVTACKKGTSGKLYAMKVMNKRRIKMKKSEQLAINERHALASVESKFVVNLKYSFHSKDDIFLILDLMTGGDLGFHLHQKGRFPKREVLYYSARIMLALQALHDKQYVYRDLKPENCLLAEDGRVKITDLGLATKITPKLHGAAGTRGYWAPEMLRRDSRGKRMTYTHTVDWFSFGCCLAEFISGSNPFRSEVALNYGLEKGQQTKEKAIDFAIMEMEPEFPPEKFEPDAADLCQQLLRKDEKKRLGYNGCSEIMSHPYFKNINWEAIISDKEIPPFIPAKDVNAATQSEIGNFVEDKKYQETILTEEDEEHYKDWDWTNPRAFAAEVIEFLIYERTTGEPLLPPKHEACCCAIM
ncbi:beta-adrenergic-receptor kinase [Fistulifera solaris]|uniref:Beta-adrenergic-receptor kinase n=1 Tax=Fistulifera solaris TaxID=1519565 RepID=A0A1Z5K8Q3_FISSO|nr:beta-adrenergic-receptor kinase [Fistulifera solaris]|eukprot:GAX22629.1 beta-adrenergic-receptor kinase [Fistulifera solaris]